MEHYNILIVDDDREIVDSMGKCLKYEGYNVFYAYDGEAALTRAIEHDIQLIIMDIMMPRLDGISALLKIREKSNIPIIMLSAKSEEKDKIIGLTMGADDYITKPYNPAELIARVKSQLRRYFMLGSNEKKNENLLHSGGLQLDTLTKEVFVDGNMVKLTATEYKILEFLMLNKGIVFSAEQIYSRVWGQEATGFDNTVMVHIKRIREKIEINPKAPRYLKVVWGIGYKIEKQP